LSNGQGSNPVLKSASPSGSAGPQAPLDSTPGNDSPHGARPRLSLEESSFRAVAESASDAIISADAQGTIVFWNRSATRIFGYSEEEALGQPLTLLMPERFQQAHSEGLRRLQSGGEQRVIGRTVELMGVHKVGAEFPIELSLSTWTTSEGRFYTGIIRDITKRKRNEEMIALLAAERMAEARKEGFGLIANEVPALLWMSDARGRPAYYNASCLAFTGHTLEEALRGAWLGAVHPEDRTGALATYQSSFDSRIPFSTEYRLRRADGEYRWLLDTGVPRFGSTGEFAGYVGSSIDITDRKQREREQEALLAMSRALRVAGSRAEMVPIVLEQISSLLGVDGAALLMRDRSNGEVQIELGLGVWAGFTGLRVPEETSLTRRVIETSEPYLCNDVPSDPEVSSHHAMGGLAAVAAMPLVEQDTIGALWVGRRTPIGREDLRLLSSIAEMTASALRRASLHEETARRLRQITALRAGQAAVSASLDLGFTLNVLLEQLTTILEVDAASVLLLDSATNRLEYAAGLGFRTPVSFQSSLRLGEGEAGRAALERQSRHIPNLRAMRSELVRKWLVDDEGFVSYHAIPLVSQGNVKGVLEIFHRELRTPNADWNTFVRMLVSQASVAIGHATTFDRVRQAHDELRMAYDSTLEGWSQALDLHDKEPPGHTRGLAETTERLARAIGRSDEEVLHARWGALLHDIGKLAIPDQILHKPGSLDEAEWEIMRQHPVYAFQVLSPIAFLRHALDIPYCHHERWDGGGYPRGLKGEGIPLAARIFAVVDVWDALRSDRPYRPAWTQERALEYFHKEMGSHFDPRVVDLFLDVVIQPFAPGSPADTSGPAVSSLTAFPMADDQEPLFE
jgi:PAS domain S-box-containing protein